MSDSRSQRFRILIPASINPTLGMNASTSQLKRKRRKRLTETPHQIIDEINPPCVNLPCDDNAAMDMGSSIKIVSCCSLAKESYESKDILVPEYKNHTTGDNSSTKEEEIKPISGLFHTSQQSIYESLNLTSDSKTPNSFVKAIKLETPRESNNIQILIPVKYMPQDYTSTKKRTYLDKIKSLTAPTEAPSTENNTVLSNSIKPKRMCYSDAIKRMSTFPYTSQESSESTDLMTDNKQFKKRMYYMGDFPEEFTSLEEAVHCIEMAKDFIGVKNRRIRTLKQTNRRLERRNNKLKTIIHDLKKTRIASEDNFTATIPTECRHLVREMFNYRGGMVSPQLRTFALTLNQHSPTAYDYVRKVLSNALPHKRTLIKWNEAAQSQPGFSQQSASILEHEASEEIKS